MKTILSLFAVALMFVTSSFTINEQQKLNQKSTAGTFSYLRAHRQGKSVAVDWAVASPDVVQFVVERSYDQSYFEPVGEVNFNGASAYKYSDNAAFPGHAYYRVTAVKADGSTESSDVALVRIIQRG